MILISPTKTMDQRLDSIIERIYDAALDQQAWPLLLNDIATAINATSGFHAGLDTRHGRGAYWHTVGHDPATQALYNQHYLDNDPTLAHIIKFPGIVFSCTDYLSDAAVAASRFYTEFLIPNGLRYVLSGVVATRGSMISFFGFQRGAAQAPFSSADKDFVQRLVPHLTKADLVAARLGTTSDARRLAMAVLDRLDYGVVLADRMGNIRLTNRRAEQWLEQAEIIQAHFGRLRFRAPAEQEAFAGLLRAATTGTAGIRQLRAANGGAVKVVVFPVDQQEQARLDDDQAQVAVVIADDHRTIAPQVLRDTYDLTPAETKVALGLASGQTQEELGASLFVSLATIKTHTQHIFRKTGVSRQADLIRLIYGLPALC
jgi:DNA-binding CsgD family transcriptional regulator